MSETVVGYQWPIKVPRHVRCMDGSNYTYNSERFIDEDPRVMKILDIGDGGGYDYSITALFRIEGKLYLGHTSGCSCTTPWEEIGSLSDLVALPNSTYAEKNQSRKEAWSYLSQSYLDLDDRLDMIRTIERELKK